MADGNNQKPWSIYDLLLFTRVAAFELIQLESNEDVIPVGYSGCFFVPIWALDEKNIASFLNLVGQYISVVLRHATDWCYKFVLAFSYSFSPNCAFGLFSFVSFLTSTYVSSAGVLLPGHEECLSYCILGKQLKLKGTEFLGVPIHENNKLIFLLTIV